MVISARGVPVRPAFWSALLLSSRGALLLVLAAAAGAGAADQPQWGERFSRNMVSDETGLPDSFDIKTGRNIRWSVPLGRQTWSTPVVASGHVFIGTNNDKPRDPDHRGDCGVLLCLDEKDGRFCWQLVVPKRGPSPYLDWPHTGLVSPVTVEGDRVYLVSNRNEIMCLDLAGMADGNDGPYTDEGRHMALPDEPPAPVNPTDADVLWLYDLDRELGVHQHDAAHCSVLLHGRYLYANTSNGVDDTHMRIVSTEAPALVVLDKNTGRLVARDDERMAPRTIHCTWSSPSLGVVGEKPLIFFGGGDAVCYAFEAPAEDLPGPKPASLKRVWRFDCDPGAPKENVHEYQDNRREGPSTITGMPVFWEDRIYVAVGGDLWHGKPEAHLKCIDAKGTGDITRTGELWSCPLKRHCMSTPAIHNGLAYIGDCGRQVHCIDAHTGRPCWTQDVKAEVWASPLAADGKVYVGTRRGELWVFKAGREREIVSTIPLGEPLNGTPTAANGTLYIPALTLLYAAALDRPAAR